MAKRTKAVGIDLGTTYSAMAYVDESGHSALLVNEEGDILTPSVVLFEDDATIVGKEAKKVAVLKADRVAVCVKRDMGKPVYSKAIAGRHLPPEVIQSYILRKLKADITRSIGPDFAAVITVPAYFDEPRRKATYDAGQMAGLNVLDIVNEPTAAALAFGEKLGYLTKYGAPKERMNVVVYDLGGGTFDVTLIDMAAGNLRTICTDGDVQLGGHDWDMRLVDFFAERFANEHGIDPRNSPESFQRILYDCEQLKHTLSARNRTKLRVDFQGKTSQIEVTREDFEGHTADLLERTRFTTRNLVQTAHLDWSQIKRVLLTGGSTRMPAVLKMIEDLTHLPPDHSVNPDEAVARGAAIYANYLLAAKGETGHEPTFDVTNVNAHSLGVEGTDPATFQQRNSILIPRNTPLPAKKTERCMTRSENQRTVAIQILEGESGNPMECTPIGRTVIRDLPPNLPQGWPVDVTYEYGVNGRLSVKAVVTGTDRAVSLELQRDANMSDERVSLWRKAVGGGGGLDAFDMAIQNEIQELSSHAPSGQPYLKPMTPAFTSSAGPIDDAPHVPQAPGGPHQAHGAPQSPAASGIMKHPAGMHPPGVHPAGMTPPGVPAQFAHGGSPGNPGKPGPQAGHSSPTLKPMGSSSGTATAVASPAHQQSPAAQPGKPAGAPQSGAAPQQAKIKPGGASGLDMLIYIVMTTLVIMVGYYALVFFAPSANFLRLNLPGLPPVQAPADPAPDDTSA